MTPVNLIGRQYGKLKVIFYIDKTKSGQHRWLCLCECGKTNIVPGGALNAGRVRSCGCLLGTTKYHGHAAGGIISPTYTSWYAMLQRCSNPRNSHYESYGGRGIEVCERWKYFPHFLADMGERPLGTTLDRINVNGNYELSNCRWADEKTQRANRRRKGNG